MLEGHDDGWQDAGTRRQAFYSDLRPGAYRFRVIASNNDGIWTQQALELHIRILPPFWRTPLAFALYALLITGALLGAGALTETRRLIG